MNELAYETLGDPRAPAIMLLHGFMSSNEQWLENQDALANTHFLVQVELWGHGSSPEADDPEQYSVAGYIEQFERIRQALHIKRWTLIGQSYGAGLAIHYALQHPDRCSGVIVTNSRSAFGRLTAKEQRHDKSQTSPFDSPDFDLRKLPYHPIHARRLPDAVKHALVKSADAMSVQSVRHGGRVGASLNCVDVLGQLSVPIMLTNGVYEKSFQQDLEQLLARYPNLHVVNLEAGHSVNIEAADRFNLACIEFLDAVQRGDMP